MYLFRHNRWNLYDDASNDWLLQSHKRNSIYYFIWRPSRVLFSSCTIRYCIICHRDSLSDRLRIISRISFCINTDIWVSFRLFYSIWLRWYPKIFTNNWVYLLWFDAYFLFCSNLDQRRFEKITILI
jgi:hypothetical protein